MARHFNSRCRDLSDETTSLDKYSHLKADMGFLKTKNNHFKLKISNIY